MTHNRINKFLRFTAFFTCLFFTVNTLAWGAGPLDLKPSVAFDGARPPALSLPDDLGFVREQSPAYSAPSPEHPLIIHIQDAHCNYSAQKNTAEILKILKKQYGIKHVFVEGAAGQLDARYLQFSENKAVNRKAAEILAKMGEMTGADLYLFENPNGLVFTGIENPLFYRKEIQELKKALHEEKESREWIRSERARLEREISRLGNKGLLTALRISLDLENEKTSFLKIIASLDNLSRRYLGRDLRQAKEQREFPNLMRLVRLRDLEGEVSAEKAKAEVRGIKNKKLSGFFDSSADPRETLEEIYSALKSSGFDFDKYPQFSRYAKQRIFESELDSAGLFDEVGRLINLLITSLAKTENEKKASEKIRDFKLVSKMLLLELSRDEWKVLSSKHRDTAPFRFYQLAERRETEFLNIIRETIKKEKLDRAVVITGGFHTAVIKENFTKNNSNYSVISPRVTGNSRTNYAKTMMGRWAKDIETSEAAPVPQALEPVTAQSLGVDIHARDEIREAAAASLGEESEQKTTKDNSSKKQDPQKESNEENVEKIANDEKQPTHHQVGFEILRWKDFAFIFSISFFNILFFYWLFLPLAYFGLVLFVVMAGCVLADSIGNPDNTYNLNKLLKAVSFADFQEKRLAYEKLKELKQLRREKIWQTIPRGELEASKSQALANRELFGTHIPLALKKISSGQQGLRLLDGMLVLEKSGVYSGSLTRIFGTLRKLKLDEEDVDYYSEYAIQLLKKGINPQYIFEIVFPILIKWRRSPEDLRKDADILKSLFEELKSADASFSQQYPEKFYKTVKSPDQLLAVLHKITKLKKAKKLTNDKYDLFWNVPLSVFSDHETYIKVLDWNINAVGNGIETTSVSASILRALLNFEKDTPSNIILYLKEAEETLLKMRKAGVRAIDFESDGSEEPGLPQIEKYMASAVSSEELMQKIKRVLDLIVQMKQRGINRFRLGRAEAVLWAAQQEIPHAQKDSFADALALLLSHPSFPKRKSWKRVPWTQLLQRVRIWHEKKGDEFRKINIGHWFETAETAAIFDNEPYVVPKNQSPREIERAKKQKEEEIKSTIIEYMNEEDLNTKKQWLLQKLKTGLLKNDHRAQMNILISIHTQIINLDLISQKHDFEAWSDLLEAVKTNVDGGILDKTKGQAEEFQVDIKNLLTGNQNVKRRVNLSELFPGSISETPPESASDDSGKAKNKKNKTSEGASLGNSSQLPENRNAQAAYDENKVLENYFAHLHRLSVSEAAHEGFGQIFPTNEARLAEAIPLVQKLSRAASRQFPNAKFANVGVSLDQNFGLLAKSDAQSAYLLDIDPVNTLLLLPCLGLIFGRSQTRAEFLANLYGKELIPIWLPNLRTKNFDELWKQVQDMEFLSLGDHRSFQRGLAKKIAAHLIPSQLNGLGMTEPEVIQYVEDYFPWGRHEPSRGGWLDAFARETWLASEEDYQKVRSRWMEGKIVGVIGNIWGPAMKKIVSELDQNGQSLLFWYISNVPVPQQGVAEWRKYLEENFPEKQKSLAQVVSTPAGGLFSAVNPPKIQPLSEFADTLALRPLSEIRKRKAARGSGEKPKPDINGGFPLFDHLSPDPDKSSGNASSLGAFEKRRLEDGQIHWREAMRRPDLFVDSHVIHARERYDAAYEGRLPGFGLAPAIFFEHLRGFNRDLFREMIAELEETKAFRAGKIRILANLHHKIRPFAYDRKEAVPEEELKIFRERVKAAAAETRPFVARVEGVNINSYAAELYIQLIPSEEYAGLYEKLFNKERPGVHYPANFAAVIQDLNEEEYGDLISFMERWRAADFGEISADQIHLVHYSDHEWTNKLSNEPYLFQKKPEVTRLTTVGFANIKQSKLLHLLRQYHTDVVIDVRAVAFHSKENGAFTAENLEEALKRNKIKYVHVPDLGAPSSIRNQFNVDRRIDKFRSAYLERLEPRRELLRRLVKFLAGKRAVLLTFPEDPEEDHRAILLEEMLKLCDVVEPPRDLIFVKKPIVPPSSKKPKRPDAPGQMNLFGDGPSGASLGEGAFQRIEDAIEKIEDFMFYENGLQKIVAEIFGANDANAKSAVVQLTVIFRHGLLRPMQSVFLASQRFITTEKYRTPEYRASTLEELREIRRDMESFVAFDEKREFRIGDTRHTFQGAMEDMLAKSGVDAAKFNAKYKERIKGAAKKIHEQILPHLSEIEKVLIESAARPADSKPAAEASSLGEDAISEMILEQIQGMEFNWKENEEWVRSIGEEIGREDLYEEGLDVFRGAMEELVITESPIVMLWMAAELLFFFEEPVKEFLGRIKTEKDKERFEEEEDFAEEILAYVQRVLRLKHKFPKNEVSPKNRVWKFDGIQPIPFRKTGKIKPDVPDTDWEFMHFNKLAEKDSGGKRQRIFLPSRNQFRFENNFTQARIIFADSDFSHDELAVQSLFPGYRFVGEPAVDALGNIKLLALSEQDNSDIHIYTVQQGKKRGTYKIELQINPQEKSLFYLTLTQDVSVRYNGEKFPVILRETRAYLESDWSRENSVKAHALTSGLENYRLEAGGRLRLIFTKNDFVFDQYLGGVLADKSEGAAGASLGDVVIPGKFEGRFPRKKILPSFVFAGLLSLTACASAPGRPQYFDRANLDSDVPPPFHSGNIESQVERALNQFLALRSDDQEVFSGTATNKLLPALNYARLRNDDALARRIFARADRRIQNETEENFNKRIDILMRIWKKFGVAVIGPHSALDEMSLLVIERNLSLLPERFLRAARFIDIWDHAPKDSNVTGLSYPCAGGIGILRNSNFIALWIHEYLHRVLVFDHSVFQQWTVFYTRSGDDPDNFITHLDTASARVVQKPGGSAMRLPDFHHDLTFFGQTWGHDRQILFNRMEVSLGKGQTLFAEKALAALELFSYSENGNEYLIGYHPDGSDHYTRVYFPLQRDNRGRITMLSDLLTQTRIHFEYDRQGKPLRIRRELDPLISVLPFPWSRSTAAGRSLGKDEKEKPAIIREDIPFTGWIKLHTRVLRFEKYLIDLDPEYKTSESQRLIQQTADGNIAVTNPKKQEMLARFSLPEKALLLSKTINADGNLIAFVFRPAPGAPAVARICDVDNQKLVNEFAVEDTFPGMRIALSPDGGQLAVEVEKQGSAKLVYLYETQSGIRWRWLSLEKNLTSLRFTSDGRYLFARHGEETGRSFSVFDLADMGDFGDFNQTAKRRTWNEAIKKMIAGEPAKGAYGQKFTEFFEKTKRGTAFILWPVFFAFQLIDRIVFEWQKRRLNKKMNAITSEINTKKIISARDRWLAAQELGEAPRPGLTPDGQRAVRAIAEFFVAKHKDLSQRIDAFMHHFKNIIAADQQIYAMSELVGAVFKLKRESERDAARELMKRIQADTEIDDEVRRAAGMRHQELAISQAQPDIPAPSKKDRKRASEGSSLGEIIKPGRLVRPYVAGPFADITGQLAEMLISRRTDNETQRQIWQWICIVSQRIEALIGNTEIVRNLRSKVGAVFYVLQSERAVLSHADWRSVFDYMEGLQNELIRFSLHQKSAEIHKKRNARPASGKIETPNLILPKKTGLITGQDSFAADYYNENLIIEAEDIPVWAATLDSKAPFAAEIHAGNLILRSKLNSKMPVRKIAMVIVEHLEIPPAQNYITIALKNFGPREDVEFWYPEPFGFQVPHQNFSKPLGDFEVQVFKDPKHLVYPILQFILPGGAKVIGFLQPHSKTHVALVTDPLFGNQPPRPDYLLQFTDQGSVVGGIAIREIRTEFLYPRPILRKTEDNWVSYQIGNFIVTPVGFPSFSNHPDKNKVPFFVQIKDAIYGKVLLEMDEAKMKTVRKFYLALNGKKYPDPERLYAEIVDPAQPHLRQHQPIAVNAASLGDTPSPEKVQTEKIYASFEVTRKIFEESISSSNPTEGKRFKRIAAQVEQSLSMHAFIEFAVALVRGGRKEQAITFIAEAERYYPRSVLLSGLKKAISSARLHWFVQGMIFELARFAAIFQRPTFEEKRQSDMRIALWDLSNLWEKHIGVTEKIDRLLKNDLDMTRRYWAISYGDFIAAERSLRAVEQAVPQILKLEVREALRAQAEKMRKLLEETEELVSQKTSWMERGNFSVRFEKRLKDRAGAKIARVRFKTGGSTFEKTVAPLNDQQFSGDIISVDGQLGLITFSKNVYWVWFDKEKNEIAAVEGSSSGNSLGARRDIKQKIKKPDVNKKISTDVLHREFLEGLGLNPEELSKEEVQGSKWFVQNLKRNPGGVARVIRLADNAVKPSDIPAMGGLFNRIAVIGPAWAAEDAKTLRFSVEKTFADLTKQKVQESDSPLDFVITEEIARNPGAAEEIVEVASLWKQSKIVLLWNMESPSAFVKRPAHLERLKQLALKRGLYIEDRPLFEISIFERLSQGLRPNVSAVSFEAMKDRYSVPEFGQQLTRVRVDEEALLKSRLSRKDVMELIARFSRIKNEKEREGLLRFAGLREENGFFIAGAEFFNFLAQNYAAHQSIARAA